MFEEKRQTIRIKKPLPVQFGVLKPDGSYSWDISLIRDISESGICLRANNKFEKDSICLLRINVPLRPGQPVEIRGKVIDTDEIKLNVFAVRILFLDLTDEEKKYLREYIAWALVNERGVK